MIKKNVPIEGKTRIHLINVDYSEKGIECLSVFRSTDIPIYFDTDETKIEINELSGDVPEDYNDYKDEYDSQIIEML